MLPNQPSPEIVASKSGKKAVYFTKVTVEGDNQFSPVSDDLYKSIFDQVLSDPLQRLETALDSCKDIQRKLLFTGLYQSAEVSLDYDIDAESSIFLETKIPKNLDVEAPIPTIANIKLIPATYSRGFLTTTTRDTYCSAGGRLLWLNSFGKAETVSLDGSVNYTPLSSKIDERLIGIKLTLPFPKNPSIRTIATINHTYLNLFKQPFIGESDEHKQSQIGFSTGIAKKIICNGNKTIIDAFSGFTVAVRNIYGFADSLAVSDSIKQFQGTFTKTSFLSNLVWDSRTFYSLFPVSGRRFEISEEYVLNQGFSSGKPVPQDSNFNKILLSYETHNPIFNTFIVNSLNINAGAIVSLSGKSKPLVHLLDSFYLGGMKSLKGFERNSVGNSAGLLFYSLGVSSSVKLPNTPVDSPLRLKSFIHFGDVLNNWKDLGTNRPPALSSGLSLVYNAGFANMDLTYALPIRVRDYDIAKPGFSFGLDLSFF